MYSLDGFIVFDDNKIGDLFSGMRTVSEIENEGECHCSTWTPESAGNWTSWSRSSGAPLGRSCSVIDGWTGGIGW